MYEGIVPVRPLVGAGKASWPEVFWLMTNEVRSERSAIVGGMDPVRRLFVNELCGIGRGEGRGGRCGERENTLREARDAARDAQARKRAARPNHGRYRAAVRASYIGELDGNVGVAGAGARFVGRVC